MTNIINQVGEFLQGYVVKLDDFEMGRKIGEGGFGVVYLAKHRESGKQCAIKKLYLKEMTGQNLILFRREAEILAKVDSLFCLPFYGWTASYPFSIVTEFVPKGTLFNALRHKDGSPDLTPTNKTIISMGIARGMKHIHSHGMIHRDLKSLNIMLDEDCYPRICDFGLARLANEEAEEFTQDVGTPHWMAPEIFDSGKYDNKVDVYAFGMLMWEMLTETAPFKGRTGVQIAYAVTKKNERPVIPSVTPKTLSNFIRQCWDQDPEKRPSMSKIYDLFQKGKVFFPGTDLNIIAKFAEYIAHDEERRARNKHNRSPLFSSAEDKEVKMQSTRESSSRSDLSNKIRHTRSHSPSRSVISSSSRRSLRSHKSRTSYTSNEFVPEELETIISRHDIVKAIGMFSNPNSDFSALFLSLKKLVENKTSDFVIYLFPPLINILENDIYSLRAFIENNVIFSLHLDVVEYHPVILRLMLIFVSKFPQGLNTQYIRLLEATIPKYCSQVLVILNPCFKNFDNHNFIWDICDLLFKYHEHFLEKCGVLYLNLLYHIFDRYNSVKSVKLMSLINVLHTGVIHYDNEIVINSYKLMCRFFDPEKIVVPHDILVKHLNNRDIRIYAASYLSRQLKVQITKELIDTLLLYSPDDSLCLYVLYNLCQFDIQAGKIVISRSREWMFETELKVIDILSLILILIKHQELRPLLAEQESFVTVLNKFLESDDATSLIEILSGIIVKMCNETKFIKSLDNSGFFKAYIKTVQGVKSGSSLEKLINTIEVISRLYFVKDFTCYISFLYNMLRNNNELIFPSLSALIVLSQYDGYKESFSRLDFEKVLNDLDNFSQYHNYTASLRQNIK